MAVLIVYSVDKAFLYRSSAAYCFLGSESREDEEDGLWQKREWAWRESERASKRERERGGVVKSSHKGGRGERERYTRLVIHRSPVQPAEDKRKEEEEERGGRLVRWRRKRTDEQRNKRKDEKMEKERGN
jgi:hypothetical protein